MGVFKVRFESLDDIIHTNLISIRWF